MQFLPVKELLNSWLRWIKILSLLQVNYLSHLLLVLKLLSVMKQSVNPADARVIFVSSRMERWGGEFNLANIQGQLSYDRTKFYSMSKLYMVRIILFELFFL